MTGKALFEKSAVKSMLSMRKITITMHRLQHFVKGERYGWRKQVG